MCQSVLMTISLFAGVFVVNISASAQDVGEVAASPKFFVNSLGMKMIHVRARPFRAWTPDFSDYESASDNVPGQLERPPVGRKSRLENDYYLAEFPVTNGMYRQFVAESGHRAPGGEMMDIDGAKRGSIASWEHEQFSDDDQPVAGLNWQDAAAFCQWLSQKDGRTYRLPDIDEWEYACRAGTDTLFWWGDRPDARYMNYAAARVGHPTPVGFYPPNPWGFYDMHGNVWECCDQTGRPGGLQKGGAWNSPRPRTGADAYADVRATMTPHMPITRRMVSMGMRLACEDDQAKPRPGDRQIPTILPAGGKGPDLPQLDIKVGEKMDLGPIPGNHVVLLVTKTGTWILDNQRSEDQGKTWQRCHEVYFCRTQLRDGTIISVGPHSPASHITSGRGVLNVVTSSDDWKTVKQFDAPVEIPLGVEFYAFEGLIELEDGTLLLTLYGSMEGDTVRIPNPLAPLEDGYVKSRVILIESPDKGRSWKYKCTLSYHPEMGNEGQTEADIIQLPTGNLFAVMRTGLHGYRDPHGREHLDEPLLAAWSRDGGQRWSRPARIYLDNNLVTGITPRALLTADNVLAVLRTRGQPGGSVIFSPDGSGTIWTDQVVFADPHGAMDDMALIGPNTILVAYVEGSRGNWRAVGLPITVSIRND